MNRLIGSIQFHFRYQEKQKVKDAYPVWQIFYWLSKSVPQFNSPPISSHPQYSFLLALDLPISILALLGLPNSLKNICYSSCG